MTVRKLYFGDNLDLLRDREQFRSESIDLVYLDRWLRTMDQEYFVQAVKAVGADPGKWLLFRKVCIMFFVASGLITFVILILDPS